MASRINVALLFGGRSGEHDVSRASGAFIMDSLSDSSRYHLLPVGITREGKWYAYSGPSEAMRDGSWLEEGPVYPAWLVPDTDKPYLFINRKGRTVSYQLDCVFPALHGPNGEDGTVQGLLELAGIPFVGCGMTASALAMDKAFANALFEQQGIPHTPWRVLDLDDWQAGGPALAEEALEGLRYPLFVKPARGGSSLGISRLDRPDELPAALTQAFTYDRKVVIEQGVRGRELEIAALGDYRNPLLSPVGEIVPDRAFYDYDSKYQEESTSQLLIPARLEEGQELEIRKLALEAWRALDCYGMARIDFFLADDGQIFLNEINTIPGFVRISMYPRLMRAAGYTDAGLLEKLIELALERKPLE